jgi:hypothetical protein
VRELLLALLLCFPLAAIAQQRTSPKFEIYKLWDDNVELLRQEGDYETGLWKQLQNSLRDDPPEHVKSLDRQAIIEELIRLHKQRTEKLERMLKVEKQ